MSLLDELKVRLDEANEWLIENAEHLAKWQNYREEKLVEVAQIKASIAAIAALEAPLQPPSAVSDAPPAASENAGEQIEASGIEGSFPSFSANDGFSALPGGVEESRDQFDVFEDDSAGYAPVVDAVDLPQVTVDQVPPVAEVIHTDDGRKKFALFGGQTHEVVEPSNTEADFWARVLHPRKENA